MARSLSNPTIAHQPKPVVKEKDRDPVAAGKRDAAFNRSASFNYFLSDKFEAGLSLRGTEVKSIREGKANLKDAYGLLKDGEAFLLNLHIRNGRVKCEIALAKGKQDWDKRATERKREADNEAKAAVARSQRR